jgi:hypothetical protein
VTSLLIEDQSNRQLADLRCEFLECDVEAVELELAGRPPPATTAVNRVVRGTLRVASVRPKQSLAVVATRGLWLAGFYVRNMRRERDGDALGPTESSKGEQQLIDPRLRRRSGR